VLSLAAAAAVACLLSVLLIPARAEAQFPASIASNTPRQSRGTWTVATGGDCTTG